MTIDIEQFGKSMGELVRDKVAPLREVVDSLTKQVDELIATWPEKGDPGEPGPEGPPGKDADPVEVSQDDILAAIKSDPEFMREVVAEYLKENPPPAGDPGPKGDPGEQGARGEKGDAGEKGADGIGATGAMIDGNGELIVTLGNGNLQRCGVVVGKDGAPGKDGADLSGVEFDYDGERTISVKARSGEVVNKYVMPVVIDRGYWRDGCVAEKGDGYTHDGTWWIALQKTIVQPSTQAKQDWRLGARKGRDGRNGKDGKDAHVNLRKDDDSQSGDS